MISKEEYVKNPCKASSLPFWKEQQMVLPDNMLILHRDDFKACYLNDYVDEKYFRLKHNLKGIAEPVLPTGFQLCDASSTDFSEHINNCYKGSKLSADELESYRKRRVYSQELWIAVKDCKTNKIIGTGIGELDPEIGEGILEWIQVSEKYRGKGIGKYIVNQLLQRMKDKTVFVTVSGKVENPTNPEVLYRKCGFEGNDIWHIMHKAEPNNLK